MQRHKNTIVAATGPEQTVALLRCCVAPCILPRRAACDHTINQPGIRINILPYQHAIDP